MVLARCSFPCMCSEGFKQHLHCRVLLSLALAACQPGVSIGWAKTMAEFEEKRELLPLSEVQP